MLRTAITTVIVSVVAAVAAGAGAAQTRAAIQPPAAIAKAGKIVFCTDSTYPPEESFKGSKTIGSTSTSAQRSRSGWA